LFVCSTHPGHVRIVEASHGALYAFTHASGFWFGRLMV
jgi:hypothetical protein